MSDEGSPPILVHRVIARLNVGGPAMHVVNVARALDALGEAEGQPGTAAGRGGSRRWRTRLIAGSVPPTEGDMSWYAAERGMDVTALPEMSREISALDDVRSLLALWRIFRRERPAVVHTHTAKAGTLGRLAALLAGVPVRFHTYHGHVLGGGYFPRWKTRLFLEIERRLARVTTRLVVLTEVQAREMAEELGVAPREKFAVVPLGLELDRFAAVDRGVEARHGARQALGIPSDARVVGIVGRLVPIKNHELFLQALQVAPELTGVVVGGGEREGELKRLAARLGIAHRLLWLGWRRDLPAIYPALDALALTSHDEGTPVAVLEALAAGVPVVARDVGGVGEVLAGVGVGAVLPRAAGPEAWARALREAVARAPVEDVVRARVVASYSTARLAEDLASLYGAALTP